jgi:hypothetical protein
MIAAARWMNALRNSIVASPMFGSFNSTMITRRFVPPRKESLGRKDVDRSPDHGGENLIASEARYLNERCTEPGENLSLAFGSENALRGSDGNWH